MSDTITVRDHNLPCKHGWYIYHDDLSGDCFGGREITLRRTTLKDHTVKPDDVMWVEVGNEV